MRRYSMHACMCAWCVCMCVCMYVRMRVCMYVFMCMYVYLPACLHECFEHGCDVRTEVLLISRLGSNLAISNLLSSPRTPKREASTLLAEPRHRTKQQSKTPRLNDHPEGVELAREALSPPRFALEAFATRVFAGWIRETQRALSHEAEALTSVWLSLPTE